MNASIAELEVQAFRLDPVADIRLRAAADARFLLALARKARRDGLPNSELRATNAKAAARKVVEHARRSSLRTGLQDIVYSPTRMVSLVAPSELQICP